VKTVVLHDRIAAELVAVMELHGAPGTIVPCTSEAKLAEALEDADVLMAAHPDMSIVNAAPRLRWIQSLASGVETWVAPPGPPACPITRMTGVYEAYMAEYVAAHLLYRTQRLAELRAAQHDRRWADLMTTSVRGRTIGIAGIGHVGSAVARIATALGLTVRALRLGSSPSEIGHVDRVFTIEEKPAFLDELDFLVIAMPLTSVSRQFLDATAIAALPSRAIVVNVSRGGLVDEAALTAALVRGDLAGAVLDTFEEEPLPQDSPLWAIPSVTVTPHMAGAVYPDEVGRVCADNLRAFAAGVLPAPIVDIARGY
jgi:phosphoglycerate dehydrogenase-like enzyme